MSWISRLFGGAPVVAPPPPPPANTVVISEDLAAQLTSAGADLENAVDVTLRAHFEAQRKAKLAAARGEKIPFWLQREETVGGDIEDELRDRVTQRRANEAAS